MVDLSHEHRGFSIDPGHSALVHRSYTVPISSPGGSPQGVIPILRVPPPGPHPRFYTPSPHHFRSESKNVKKTLDIDIIFDIIV